MRYMDDIRRILEKEPSVVFAYLFGSYAKGTQDEKSDIDIAVYLADDDLLERDPLYPSRLAIKIEKALHVKKPVDVRVLNGGTLRFRNLLVHRYGRIDTRRMFIIMSEDIKDIRDFSRKVLDYIS